MHIRVNNLHVRPLNVEISEPVESFPALVAMAEQGAVIFTGEVTGSLTAGMAGDLVRLEGRVTVTVVMSCGRCLCELRRSLDVPFHLCYHQVDVPLGASDDAEEIELTLRDMELTPFTGDEIDPKPEIAQELIMALPQAVLCQEECAGLCPVCGGNLNTQACECAKPVFHEGLARLKDLKIG